MNHILEVHGVKKSYQRGKVVVRAREWTIIAFIFVKAVCVIFCLYPAKKASRLNPVEALRYE